MAEGREQRRLAAILAADVVGYSRLMETDETGTLARLRALRRDIIDPSIAAHSGRMVKLMGDGALVEFASAIDAVTCAVEIQKSVHEHNASRSGRQARSGFGSASMSATSSSTATTSTATGSTSRPGWKDWRNPAASSSRARPPTRCATRCRSGSRIAATLPSRTSRGPSRSSASSPMGLHIVAAGRHIERLLLRPRRRSCRSRSCPSPI